MKKRSVAVAMAAMTMATTVAPVVANAAGEETNLTVSQYAAVENQLKGYINTRYSNNDKSVYNISVKGINKNGEFTGSSSDKFVVTETTNTTGTTKEKALENLEKVSKAISNLNKGQVVTFEVQDLGHRVDDEGKVLDTGFVKLKLSDVINKGINLEKTKEAITVTKDYLKDSYEINNYGTVSGDSVTAIKEIRNDKTAQMILSGYLESVEVNDDNGSVKLVLNTPATGGALVGKNNKKVVANNLEININVGDDRIDLSKPIISNNEIIGFEKVQDVIGKSEADIITVSNSTSETINISQDDLESKAKELQDKYEFSNLSTAKNDIKEVNGVFEVTLFANTIKIKNLVPDGTMAQITLKSKSKAELEKLIDLLNGQLGDVTSIIGTNRVDTAIQLSKANYNTKNGLFGTDKAANNIVLVGENAIVDGLSAAPLASAKEAPVLLTNSKTLNPEVKEEIKRAMNLEAGITAGQAKTVYIVGGESVVSSDIETELTNMGLTVKRLAGTDRSKTSLEVAEEVGTTTKAFVVGGEGLADAMSIAPVAAREKSPIIVVNKENLSDEVKTTLKSFGTADIIGGEGVVSENAKQEIDDLVVRTSTRVEGKNRKETNAAVIKKYYSNVDKFYVAKDGSNAVAEKVNTELVDALAAAPIAGKNNAPVVLATNDVNAKQSIAINDVKSTQANKLVQVGGGIAKTVIDQVKDLLGL